MTEEKKEHPPQEQIDIKNEENPTLKWAWQRFAIYDSNSMAMKPIFLRFQMWILVLGVMTTFLALSQTELSKVNILGTAAVIDKILQYIIVSLPILISILVSASNKFKPGIKSILLRAAAESIKREIFRYRMLAALPVRPKPKHKDSNEQERSLEEILVDQVNSITNHLMETELNATGLVPYKGPLPPLYATSPEDKGFDLLNADQYIHCRVVDQMNYYQNKSKKMGIQLNKLYWSIYIFGGLGTLLASVGLELWVALTTSLVGVCTTYMEYQQIENIIILYNQAAASLSEIKSSWEVLPKKEKEKPEKLLMLVERTEEVLLSEHQQWIKWMDDAMENLQEQDKTEESKGDDQKPNPLTPLIPGQ